MFDELIRATEKLDGKHEIDISVPLDDKRYYDRQCPSSSCRDVFKVQFDDWSNKVLEDGAICPFCGYKAPADEWNTSEQTQYSIPSPKKKCIDLSMKRLARRYAEQNHAKSAEAYSISRWV